MEINQIKEFVETVQMLYHPQKGCPADKVRPLKDIIYKLRDEVNEAVSAYEKGDTENLKEEVGDVLLNIIHIIEISKRDKLFDLSDTLDNTIKKLIRRHPHVWGNRKCETPEEAEAIWEEIKQKEKLGLV